MGSKIMDDNRCNFRFYLVSIKDQSRARSFQSDDSSFARLEEKKWDAEDSIPPFAGRDVVPNVPDLFGVVV